MHYYTQSFKLLTVMPEIISGMHLERIIPRIIRPSIILVPGFNLKNRKDISYRTIIRSAICPVPHGPDLPIPSPPDTLDNILDDLDQISHISSDSDDGYDSGTNDPELFS
ncbi:hypothetical protein TNCV_1481641 [Trichonephila clavipes]|nr:hypothetical protein TNCV_1481641 [Trichonephila clavipes]